ncbi:MAG: hypothetical protein LH613_11105, partial [Chamaesiphon sp.]|nr:hypothetical protein [Chamaesiphon sp.]
MLKIWLTWLQPGLGVFGTALVLSNPLCAYATIKPVAYSISKIPTQSQWSIARSTGTTLDKQSMSGIASTPDLAVRRLAIAAMTTPAMRSAIPVAKMRPSSRNTLNSFVLPSAKFSQSSARVKSLSQQPQPKNSVAAALARAINPQNPVPVPGLFIGNSGVRTAKRFAPTVTTRQSIASATEIGAPTPLSAMMAAKVSIDPFPVVRPELMQKLERGVTASAPATKTGSSAINPLAEIPSRRPQAVKSKGISQKVAATHSLDPIAAIPSGLQRLLGNNLNSQPIVASAPVAKAISIKPRAVLALKQLASPAVVPTSVSASSLQLATAQAYTTVPKFDIPGERLLSAKPMKSTANLLLAKRGQKNLNTAVVTRKSNYVAILTATPKQSWTIVNQSSNLGGLILGSPPVSGMSKVV